MASHTQEIERPVASSSGFFGLDCTRSEAEICLHQIPLEVTVSFRGGTALGPEALRLASHQVDLQVDTQSELSEKIYTAAPHHALLGEARHLRQQAQQYLKRLGEHQNVDVATLERINVGMSRLYSTLKEGIISDIEAGRKIVTVGGDHSTSYPALSAYAERYPDLVVLHFDAHADLRKHYEGFEHSHASIMRNISELYPHVQFEQIGIRDFSAEELDYINASESIQVLFGSDIAAARISGDFNNQIDAIMNRLSGKAVYISFDIDGLDATYCPNTGTPVPGGLSFSEASYILQRVREAGMNVIGADLVEVCPTDPSKLGQCYDEIVGAQLLKHILATLN